MFPYSSHTMCVSYFVLGHIFSFSVSCREIDGGLRVFFLNKCRMFRVDVVGTCVHVQYARNGQVRVAKVDANGSWRVSLIRPERSAEKAEPPPATTVGRITSFSCSPPVALFKSR